MGARRIDGFTMIELMIVVAIMAFIVMIAVPGYQDQVRRARRAQAQADLTEITQAAERYFTMNNRYTGFGLPFAQSPKQGTAHYVLRFSVVPGADTYTVEAAPQGDQTEDPCGTMSLAHTGARTAARADCWR